MPPWISDPISRTSTASSRRPPTRGGTKPAPSPSGSSPRSTRPSGWRCRTCSRRPARWIAPTRLVDANGVLRPVPSATRAGRADRPEPGTRSTRERTTGRAPADPRGGTSMPTFETPEPISVTVDLGVGDIRIVAGDRTDTVVDVSPSDPAKKGDVSAAEQTRVEFANGRLVVRAPKGWRQWTPWGGGGSIDVQIDLPSGSRVGGSGGVAPLRCSGRLAECRYRTGVGDIGLDEAGRVELKTGAGDISVTRVDGPAEVTTGSGAIRIAGIDETAVVRNGNGDTWIGEVGGDARVNAANGTISIDLASATVAA